MGKRCEICGTNLNETNYGNWWCPICFEYRNDKEKVEDNTEIKDKSYIG